MSESERRRVRPRFTSFRLSQESIGTESNDGDLLQNPKVRAER